MPYVGFITDDPDPIDPVWDRHSPTTVTRDVLNPSGRTNGDGPPSLVVNPVSGWTLVAWARATGDGHDVVLSVHDGSGWSAPVVLAGTAADEVDPSLLVLPNGVVHLLYAVGGPDPRILHREAPGDLSSWTAPARVSPVDQPASKPHGAWHGGLLRVVYQVDDFGPGQTPRKVVLAKRDASGYQAEIVAITHNAGEVEPQVHSHAGRLWVEWVDSGNELAWTRIDALGRWETLHYEPFSGAADRRFSVRPGIRLSAIAP